MKPSYILTEEQFNTILAEAQNINHRTPRDCYEHNVVSNSAQNIIRILIYDDKVDMNESTKSV